MTYIMSSRLPSKRGTGYISAFFGQAESLVARPAGVRSDRHPDSATVVFNHGPA